LVIYIFFLEWNKFGITTLIGETLSSAKGMRRNCEPNVERHKSAVGNGAGEFFRPNCYFDRFSYQVF
jgi:hypothetical protein